MFKRSNIVLLFAAAVALSGCKSFSPADQKSHSHFTGLADFSRFTPSQNNSGQAVLFSPEIKSPIPWNELIVSWNAGAPAGTFLKIEASVVLPDHNTKFYTLGNWSPDNRNFSRTSVRGQRDVDGNVDTDILVLNQTARAVLLRGTLGGTNGPLPA